MVYSLICWLEKCAVSYKYLLTCHVDNHYTMIIFRALIAGMEARRLRIRTVVAVDRKMGIGYRGGMPWPLMKTDYGVLQKLTTETKTKGLQNAVVFGRRTWEWLIREEGKKYANRFNVVITSKPPGEMAGGADLVCTSLDGALERLQSPPLSYQIEQVYILGGGTLYQEAMVHEQCDRLYVTELEGVFPADVYYPPIDHTLFRPIQCEDVPQGEYTEHGIMYRFSVYQKL